MADNSVHVLVVEDEQEIRELMALHLLRQGYRVTECASAEEALNEMNRQNYSLFVLDWMLPGLSGVDIVDKIKAKNTGASVLMVTAKTEPQDIVAGLEKGADDYMTKPFNPSVFIARIKALLRRSQVQAAAPAADDGEVSLLGLKINFKSYEISYNGEPLHLTPSEFKLLGALVQNHGCVLTREQLIENIQGEGINVVGRTIDTHVFGLRKKLGEWGDRIETIRGVGYRVKVDIA
ncbi:response regulator transcription factor [Bdellovibrio bacteriovorus]|uniref:response regulator transcription factor n=1 Tax=Bdellovibrio bacteriovorus TaxID=959 RepID=UPI0002F23178|nr:response regulator transcription factor [Bdellovibrio bacteriovorus]BEV67502.1 Phosphate regulon transcriptional regulatory protein PhoB [Bdellovibrio bacteriovorus]